VYVRARLLAGIRFHPLTDLLQLKVQTFGRLSSSDKQNNMILHMIVHFVRIGLCVPNNVAYRHNVITISNPDRKQIILAESYCRISSVSWDMPRD
jgi:hypothetical protein